MTNIEDELKRFYTENTPPIDPAEKRRVVEMMARESQKTSGVPASESISFRRFVLTQVRFIDPICWILQVALIACVLIVGDTYRTSEIQALAHDARVEASKCTPRCLRKLCRATQADIERSVRQLAEQSYERMLDTEQLAAGWAGG